jgi:hypothetical protein
MTRMRISLAASGGATFLLAILTLYNGATVINAPTDNFILLGAAWRTSMGQVAHVDFNNPIGIVTFALVEAGMSLGGQNAGALAIACVLFLAAAATWAAWIAFQRFPPMIAGALVVWVALMCVATRPLGYDPDNHSYAMLYNRFGWITLGLLALQALIPPTRPSKLPASLEAASLGLLLAITAYIKVNFAVFGFLVVCLALVCRPELRSARSISVVTLSAISLCLGLWLILSVDPFHYLADLNSAVQSQSISDRILRVRGTVKHSLFPLGLLFLAWLIFMRRRFEYQKGVKWCDIVLALKVSFLCAAAILIAAGNTGESGETPLYAFAGLVFLAHANFPSDSGSDWAGRAILGAAILMPGVLIGSRDLASIVDSTMWRTYRVIGVDEGQRFDAQPLRADFVIPATSHHITQFWPAREMPRRLNDGFTLLRNHVAADSRVFTVALTDLFSFALGLTPPRGGPLWWDRNLSYSPKAPPPADKVFADVTHVMIPIVDPSGEGCCWEPLIDLQTMYGEYLQENFIETDKTQYWLLLERKLHS